MKPVIIIFGIWIMTTMAVHVEAQNFNLSPPPMDENIAVGFKFNRALFKEDLDLNVLSGVYKFYGTFSLKKAWQLYAEVPLVIVSVHNNDYNESNSGLGNVFIEAQKALNADKTTYLNFGLYLPSIGSEYYERMFLGALSDIYHFVQYMEGITFNSTFGYHRRGKPGAILGLDLGPDVYIPTSGTDEEVEFLLHYGLKGGYNLSKVSLWAEFSGMWILTEEGDISDNSWNQILFVSQANTGRFRPGIFYGLFINRDFREETSGILGLTFQFVF